MRFSSSLLWAILGLLCGLAFFWNLGGNGLFDLDEALYVESAREMNLRGDYVTPRVNNEPFFEKPPLIYWEAALLFRLLGRNEMTARLPSALASTAVVALLFWFGTRTFGRRAGFIAACSFALCPLALGTARQLTTDATLNLCILAALVCFFLSQESRVERREGDVASRLSPLDSRLCPYGFWLVCALGVLAKGLPGILIPCIVGGLYMGFSTRWRAREMGHALLQMRPVGGLFLFFVVTVPWHLLAWQQSGQAFYHEYIVVQHLARFRGGDTAHKAPFWFFVPGFLVGFFPLSVFVPAAIWDRRRTEDDIEEAEGQERESKADRARLFLKIWALTVFVMFSASGSKLISYILPMYPAAALLAGDWCGRVIEGKRGERIGKGMLHGAVFSFSLCMLLFMILLFHEPVLGLIESRTGKPVPMDQIPDGALPWATHLFGAVTAATGAFLFALIRHQRRQAFVLLGLGMTLFLSVAIFEGFPLIDRALLSPLQTLASTAGKQMESGKSPAGLALYIGPPRRPSVLFYLPDDLLRAHEQLGKPFIPELMDDGKDFTTIDRFVDSGQPCLVLTSKKRADRLLGKPDIVLIDARGGWSLVICHPPAALQVR